MTAEEARQSIISQADIMCESCGRDCGEWCGDREALEIAAEALEKQSPVRPLQKYETRKDGWIKRRIFGCPVCKRIVSCVQDYCESCGQAIDWDKYKL